MTPVTTSCNHVTCTDSTCMGLTILHVANVKQKPHPDNLKDEIQTSVEAYSYRRGVDNIGLGHAT